ncbi:AraC family transcriptional regulator [Clostridium oryzae]|uniref:Transposon Tn10 TetD protein n=1 Tax=Clostridium oryzae TaxID=1450648 RepID=A0A1V4ITJ1_9CLOT|nr:AraC family transcriptional regulator [Clostridium oryzae]OPJ63246.1 transposon Tn10 TetD protein [Clostridium oryzae]
MQGSYEKTILEPDFPFRLFFNDGYGSVSHHWHEDIEIIYLVEGALKVGVNSRTWKLKQGDIIIIGSGEVHYFFQEKKFSNRAVIQFRLSIYDSFLSGIKDAKALRPMLTHSICLTKGNKIHALMEKHIKEIISEYSEAKEGYKLILKARLYDLAGILLRYMPKEEYSLEELSREKERLKRMESIFQYVEANYQNQIDLDEISKAMGFSKYYFTKFFKKNVGMTFVDYLSNFRVMRAQWSILQEEDSMAEVAYKSGFNSIKTFNRVFKNITGCSPMEYKKHVNNSKTGEFEVDI